MKFLSPAKPFYLLPAILATSSISEAWSVAAPNNKPTIALAPAAWFSPVHYSEYLHQLHHAGYSTITQQLPSCGSSNPGAQSVASDAAFIRENLLMPPINAGRELVLILHSYSGGPGAVAAKGLSVVERRAAGQPGGILGLIYISAFIAKEGDTLLGDSGGKFSPWVVEYDDGQLGVRNAKDVFFNGVPDVLANRAVAQLKNQSRHSAETPCGAPAWSDSVYNGRRAFVHCALDRAIVPAAQDFMVQQSGVSWDIKTFNTSHAPFVGEPVQLSTWTDSEIAKFSSR